MKDEGGNRGTTYSFGLRFILHLSSFILSAPPFCCTIKVTADLYQENANA